MKATTKVAITGAVVVMLTGAGIWLSHRGGEKPMPKANEVKVERQTSVGAPAMVVSRPKKKEEDDFTFEEFNKLLDEWLGNAEGTERKNLFIEVTSDVASDKPEKTDIIKKGEVEESTISRRIIEQHRRYEILAQLLPRYFELNKLITKIDGRYPFLDDAPDGLSDLDRACWYEQEIKKWRAKYSELYAELTAIETSLLEHFPEAVQKVYLDNDHYQFRIDFKKLRELVGGWLPTDK